MHDLARLTLCYRQIFARHRSPSDIGRARASPAIDAMTIAQSKGLTLQHVSCPAANASTSELHKIRLAHFNHESTRMNTNSCSHRSGRRPRFHSTDWGAQAASLLVTAASRRDLENSESWIAVCRAARFHVVFKIGAERFSGDPSFTRQRRSMSLREVRRLDWLKCKVGRRTTRQWELIRYQDCDEVYFDSAGRAGF